MPGPAVHHLISDEVAKRIHALNLTPDAAKLLADFAPYLHFGAQGPDPLFFNTKDLSPELRTLVRLYFDAVDFMEEFKKEILKIIPPELIAAVETLEAVWDNVAARSSTITEIQQLLGESQALLGLLQSTLQQAAIKYLTDTVNVFNQLKHPIQDVGQPHDIWWWFDTLHYRRTGQFAQTLLKNANPGTAEHAYAIGYLTHFAADTVGHPFVNIMSGGPYRTHAQRHKFVENHQDTYAFKEMRSGEEFVESDLWKDYVMGSETKLPDGVRNLILKSIKEVYFKNNDSEYGAEMNDEDLDDVYRMWLKWFKNTTQSGELPPPVPYSFTAEIAEVWETFTDNVGDIGDMVSGAAPGDFSLASILEFLAALVLGGALLAAALIDFLAGAITTLGAAPIRFLISLAYESLYNAFMNFYQGVVLNGLAFPTKAQLGHYLSKHTVASYLPDNMGQTANSLLSMYPTRFFEVEGLEQDCHLVYPVPALAELEPDATTGAPSSYYKATNLHYIQGQIKFEKEIYKELKEFRDKITPADAPSDVQSRFDRMERKVVGDTLGNAIDFSVFLYREFLNGEMIPDFNLDGDRGVGYLCWRKVKDDTALNDPSAPTVAVLPSETVKHVQTDIISPNSSTIL